MLKRFKDIKTEEVYEKDTEIEMTVKRADEVADNLGRYGAFLERLDVKEDENVEEVEEAKEDKKEDKKDEPKKEDKK